MEISDNILALDQGEKIAYGKAKEIQNNKKVIVDYVRRKNKHLESRSLMKNLFLFNLMKNVMW